METFFVVWNPMGGNPTMRHPSEGSARSEAERLARENPGRQFFVLEALTVTVKNDVRTERLGEHELPF